ncbi:MAG TPA: response regulator transcription factor [Micromonosporaceae bacterium]|nr:response regulator transcription factor [Micromonosporaceae bacterium]
MRILVVEDNEKMAALVRRGLTEQGYAVDVAATGEDALWLASETTYAAIVLDIVLDAGAGPDGFEVCRRLREAGDWTPVLMLTARDAVPDRVRGLDLGADDYLTKPFAFAELIARVRSAVRRGARPRPTVLTVGDLRLDPATHDVRRGETGIDLTAKEFSLLECFMRNSGEVLTRSMLIERTWDFAYESDTNVVDVHVCNLRNKIDRPFGMSSLETVRGVGYRLSDAVATQLA